MNSLMSARGAAAVDLLAARRPKALAAWRDLPMPGSKTPGWRNSPVAPFAAGGAYPAASPEEAAPLMDKTSGLASPAREDDATVRGDEYSSVLRFVNGRLISDPRIRVSEGIEVSSGAGALSASMERFMDDRDLADKFYARFWAETGPVFSVSLAPNLDLAKPILLDWVDGREGVYAAPLFLVRLGEGARARFTLRWRCPRGREGRMFLSPGVFVDMGRDSSLDVFELVEAAPGWVFLDFPTAFLDDGASLRWSRGTFGGKAVKSRVLARLAGRASRFDFAAASAAGRGQQVEVSVIQRHEGPLTWSRSRLDSVADGDGRVVSHGIIEVRDSAKGTDAYLSSGTLTLSPQAQALSLPELTIDTNDLSASHGATVGSVSPEDIFYLESRGLDPVQAKSLIAAGTLGALLARTPENMRAVVEGCIEHALSGAGAREEPAYA